jgi:hypothetical protein
MKCLLCNGAEIGVGARAIEQHARTVHNQTLAEWKQAHEQLSVADPQVEDQFAPEIDEEIAEESERKKP